MTKTAILKEDLPKQDFFLVINSQSNDSQLLKNQ